MGMQDANTPIFPGMAAAITKDDNNFFSPSAVYVGTGGTVVCVPADAPSDATTVTFVGVQSGQMLPVMVKAIKATGTTASDFVRVY